MLCINTTKSALRLLGCFKKETFAKFLSSNTNITDKISQPNTLIHKNDLEKSLISRIKMKGPLTVAEYMKEALGNPIWVDNVSNCFILSFKF